MNSSFDIAWNLLKIENEALAGMASWIEHCPAKSKVTGSIPSQSTCLGCRAWSAFGAYVRSNRSMFLSHMDVSFPLFLPPFPSL